MKLFYTIKAYDFETQKEAEKHILKMKEKGWEVYSPDGEIISYLGSDIDLPYEIRYIKY